MKWWALLLVVHVFYAQQPTSLYLVTRGTASKLALVAPFNLQDRFASHVGIGFIEQGRWNVFHVSNEATANASALVQTDLDGFTQVPDMIYWALWRTTVDAAFIDRLKHLLSTFEDVGFDFEFDLDSRKLYCSEFCVQLLQRLDSDQFCFEPISRRLEPFQAALLGRTVLHYWPVDFFQINNRFVLERIGFGPPP